MIEALAFLRSHGLHPEERQVNFIHRLGWGINEYMVREKYVDHFGFAIPDDEALEIIAKHSPILEVGAGSGYWSYELKKIEADVVATDPQLDPQHKWDKQWVKVEKLTASDALVKYPKRTPLLVWPSLGKEWAHQVLKEYSGNKIIYVGEWNGCTADEAFHELLDKEWEEIICHNIPQFYGLHDCLWVLQRKKQ